MFLYPRQQQKENEENVTVRSFKLSLFGKCYQAVQLQADGLGGARNPI